MYAEADTRKTAVKDAAAPAQPDEDPCRRDIPTVSTIVKAPERNLWSSLFATDRSNFKRYSGFSRSCENARRPTCTYAEVGFLGKIVAKMVAPEVPKNAKFVQILPALSDKALQRTSAS